MALDYLKMYWNKISPHLNTQFSQQKCSQKLTFESEDFFVSARLLILMLTFLLR